MIPKDYRPQRGLGQAVTRQRRRLNKEVRDEADRRRANQRQKAAQELSTTAQRVEERKENKDRTWVKALINAGTSQARAVIGSTGVTVKATGAMPRIHSKLEYTNRIMAYTDFTSIHVSWPWYVYARDIENGGGTARQGASIHSSVKGTIYHEFGHIQFTVPFPDLVAAANEVELPLPMGTLKYAWNLLEDQRMEAAVINDAPIKAVYFKQMMLKYIVVSPQGTDGTYYRLYPLVAGRSYLPAKLVSDIRKAYVHEMGADKADRVDEIVSQYKEATDAATMLQAVIDMHSMLDSWPPDRSHEHHPNGGLGDEEVDERLQESASEDSDDEDSDDEAGIGSSDEDSDEDSDEVGSGSSDDDESIEDESELDSSGGTEDDGDEDEEDGDEDEEDGNTATRNASHTSPPTWGDVQDDIEDLLNETLNEIISKDDGLTDALACANESRDTLPELDAYDYPEFPADQSDAVAIGIERALSDFVTMSSPVWQYRQEEGTLVPIDFRTRSVGDDDYYTSLKGAGTVGVDLHLSFLADASMSMNGIAMMALSQSMYATAVACDRLGISSTYCLWSDGADHYRIWSEGQPSPVVWPSLGGTDPSIALDDCDSHNLMGKSHHLILIFTDGEWGYDFGSLQRWARPDRTIAVIQYSPYQFHYDRNPNEADYMLPITSIHQIPQQLTYMVHQIMGS